MRTFICMVAVCLLASMAVAELQNVQVGGEIRIRGRYWRNGWDGIRETRIPNFFVPLRPIGPFGVTSLYDWSSQQNDRKIVEQRSALHVQADFTDDVCAYIDLHDWFLWGEDFRSDYVTGADFRANTSDDVEVYQAYIQAENLMSVDNLRLRIGRQDIVMGKGWLVGSHRAITGDRDQSVILQLGQQVLIFLDLLVRLRQLLVG